MQDAIIGPRRHRLVVDHRERDTHLFRLLRESADFEIDVGTLAAGDYVVADQVTVERKTIADFSDALFSKRMFEQAARLGRCSRPLLLVEGTDGSDTGRVHRHAFLGAIASLGLGWRIPVVFSRAPEESVHILRIIADQARWPTDLELPRGGYRPRRLSRRKLFVLQGLPGIGPRLAGRLLAHFGSVGRVMEADEEELQAVEGIGRAKAAGIRRLLE